MRRSQLIKSSLWHYRKTHLGIVIGAFLGTMILTGALIVGDSVRHSLIQMALARLGDTQAALTSGDRFFRSGLADDLADKTGARVAPILNLKGLALAQETQLRANRVQILGVDRRFWEMGGLDDVTAELKWFETVINRRLARHLQVDVGDEILIRVEKSSLLPGEVPFTSKENRSAAFRMQVAAILEDNTIGRFGLRSSQIAPFNCFFPLAWLGEEMERENKANILLAAGSDVSQLTQAMQSVWRPEDAQLEFRPLAREGVEIRSDRVFMDRPLEKQALGLDQGYPVITYFVNGISHEGKTTPYSFVSAPGDRLLPQNMKEDEIILNRWTATDIGAEKGDWVEVTYWLPGLGHELLNETARFRVRRVVAMAGFAGDESLMPHLPGLSDADNCRDWDPGIPIDLDLIRDKDETYWDLYKGTPKAFITEAAARKLWAGRFGEITAIRFPAPGMEPEELTRQLMARTNPADLGLIFRSVRQEALEAGSEAVDFGQLFLGLSFFIIAAAVLLTALLFVLGAEQRKSETGILLAVGYPQKRVRGLLMAEGSVLALAGGLLGALGGIVYNQIVLYFLGTLWKGATGTANLTLLIQPATLAFGAAAGIFTALAALWIAARNQAQKTVRELQGAPDIHNNRHARRAFILGTICLLGVVAILLVVNPGRDRNAADAFWGAGFLMLAGTLALANGFLIKLELKSVKLTLPALSIKNTVRRRGRSLATMGLLACGIFIVMAVGANRHDVFKGSELRTSGTGGFAFYGETTLPVRQNMNSSKSLHQFGLENFSGDIHFVQMRSHDGDDASCLNLNRIKSPRILSVDPHELDSLGAFGFAVLGDEADPDHPWLSLNADLGEQTIAGIADQTVIVWGFGKSVGDTLTYTDEQGRTLYVKLVAALANTMMQGNLIVSEEAFLRHFPSGSGSHVFLVDAPREKRQDVQRILSRSMQDYGLELTPSALRLAEFKSVENTYLSIFMALGGLGMLLGTVGLGVIVSRNILERRAELALLKAVGFGKTRIENLLIREHLILLGGGVISGTLSALTAVLPAILSPGVQIPWLFLGLTLALIFFSGWLWTRQAVRHTLKEDLIPALRSE